RGTLLGPREVAGRLEETAAEVRGPIPRVEAAMRRRGTWLMRMMLTPRETVMVKRLLAVSLSVSLAGVLFAADPVKLDPVPKPLQSDPSVKVDYDIVYVRAPRVLKAANGRDVATAWPEFGHPTRIDAGYDLMLRKPDGKEEVLVEGSKG